MFHLSRYRNPGTKSTSWSPTLYAPDTETPKRWRDGECVNPAQSESRALAAAARLRFVRPAWEHPTDAARGWTEFLETRPNVSANVPTDMEETI